MNNVFYSVQGIRKSFAGEEVLHGIDLQLRQGDILAIVGPSGAGKTTLLRCLDFLDQVDAGTMVFHQKTLDMARAHTSDIAAFRRRTSFVFQNYNLFLNKTALENIAVGLRYAQKMNKTDARNRAAALLAKVAMSDYADKFPSELSGGQQQRVAIARALAPDPDLIFLDEPTSALDPEHTNEVLSLLSLLVAEGRTLIVVTHALSFARRLSTRAALLENGKIIEENTTAEFFSHPQELRTREFLLGKDNLQEEK